MNIILTGATGAVGSFHVPELLRRGHQVTCLVRGENPRERLASVMPGWAAEQVDIVSGDIILPLGGIDPSALSQMKGKFDFFVHHAGSVTFDNDCAAETFAANVGGTANMLGLAEELGVISFCYNSSVYATTNPPRNPYEASKAAAEKLVRNWRNGKFMIVRPSIVVGSSVTGETNSYTGYYGWMSGFSYMKHQLYKLWEQSRSSCQGFYFENGELVLSEPLWLDYTPSSTLNLIPVEWLATAMTDILENGECGRAYNLADPRPRSMEWMVENSFSILGIKGMKHKGASSRQQVSQTLFQIQQHMDSRLRIFYPYVTVEDVYNCDALKGNPPSVDKEFLETMLNYALSTKFGHNKE